MGRRGSLAALVLLAALAGCSSEDSTGTPSAESASASASASGSESTSGSASPTDPTAAADDSEAINQLFHVALKPLLDEPVIDFRHDVYSGQALAIETKGRAFQQAGWQAETTSPRELGSADAPQGDDIKGSMQVRAVGDDLFMQLSSWEPPLAGCWLRTGSGQVPGGQLAMTPGVPGYITLLAALRPQEVVQQDGTDVVLAAGLPLRVGLQLLTTGVLGLLQLDASQLDGATIPVGVKVQHAVVTDVELLGTDLVSAVRAAGGDVTPDAEATLDQLRISVAYKAGPADAPKVAAPAPELVMSPQEARSNSGC
jgi:hypothetical protein